MILHTIVPLEQVFSQPAPEYRYRQMNNSYIEERREGDGYVISRVLSTNPRMYLNPNYQPGAVMKTPER